MRERGGGGGVGTGGGPTTLKHHKEVEVINSFRTPRPTK